MDKEKQIPTAKDFIKNSFIYEPKIFSKEEACELMHEYAVLFARYHRERMIEAIKGKAEIKRKTSGDNPLNYKSIPYICPYSIENAYPEDKIK